MNHTIVFDKGLANFQPLKRVLAYDDFDNGHCGWLDLKPNFVGENFKHHESFIDHLRWGPPMLSTATFRFPGTHGSMSGTYSLKVSTRATANRASMPLAPGGMGHAIKRLSRPADISRLQIEAWYSYTAEQDRPGLGETSIRAFGVICDLQDSVRRGHPGVRYVNSADGVLQQYWQVTQASDVTDEEWAFGHEGDWGVHGIDPQWYGRRYSDGSGDSYKRIPGSEQKLIYNETDGKINWMYLRLLLDLKEFRYLELQSGDRTFDISGFAPTGAKPYERIHNLINPFFFIESDTDRRAFLYLDSVVISAE